MGRHSALGARRSALLGLASLIACTAPAAAQLRPNPLFADGAVLQRGVPVPVWGTGARSGERVAVSLGAQRVSATAAADGRWTARLAPLAAGGPYALVIAGERDTVRVRDVMAGEVWVAGGQSNMGLTLERAAGGDTVLPRSADSLLRVFLVGRDTADTALAAVRRGRWARADSAALRNFSAVAYFFARDLRRAMPGVAVGVIGSYWGGTGAAPWASRAALERVPALRGMLLRADSVRVDPSRSPPRAQSGGPGGAARNPQHPGVLHNAMIAPLQPYAIRGAIWYQGEANAGRADEYRTLFPTMIADWRAGWGQGDFPFLFVQLPNYLPDTVETLRARWAQLRAAQLHASRVVPNAAMVVTVDLGEPHNLHPTRKDVVGARLALAARAVAYGERNVEYAGPRYESMAARGDSVLLAFTHRGGGLRLAPADSVTGFEVAGADGVWAPARAALRGDRVLVWSPAVRAPKVVRYGWLDNPPVTLTSAEGLPASPFRTDDGK